MSDGVVYLTGIIVIIVGLGFIIAALVTNGRVKAAENWPATIGTVLRSEIKEYITRGTGITNTSYEPVVHYQYNLMGKTYAGKRLGFGPTRMKNYEAQQVTDKYLSGSQVSVHYNPNKPEESVLEVSSRSSKTFIVLGGIFVAIGLILILFVLF
jgi:hypothetical protein